MKLTAPREDLLAPLQSVIGVVERRQTMPVLANVLLAARENKLSITGTDLEVELVATTNVSVSQSGDITVPGRKLLDIFRALPEKTSVTLSTEGERVSIRAGRSRFTLSSCRPPNSTGGNQRATNTTVAQENSVASRQDASMAQQDVRYYPNGLLLETDGAALRAVATDGHRLALCEMELPAGEEQHDAAGHRRKGRAPPAADPGRRGYRAGRWHEHVALRSMTFASLKLIDGRFPEYGRVIPASPLRTVEATASCQALQRTAILSNEKYRGIA
jgi:DNA polymerase-3 subunit beta